MFRSPAQCKVHRTELLHFPSGRPEFLLSHKPSQTKHEGSLVSHNCSARKCPLRSCFPWRTEYNFKPWKKSSVGSSNGIVINASTQWSFTRGLHVQTMQAFLLRRRWHRKKKRGLLCKHQEQTHNQWWPSESPIHLFSCWPLVVPVRSRRLHWTDVFTLLCTLISGNSWNVNGNFSKCYISFRFCFDFTQIFRAFTLRVSQSLHVQEFIAGHQSLSVLHNPISSSFRLIYMRFLFSLYSTLFHSSQWNLFVQPITTVFGEFTVQHETVAPFG